MTFRLSGRIPRYAALPADAPAIDVSPQRSSPIGGKAKRGFDVVFASVALIALSPLFLLIAALIKVSDGGPIFYRHRRVGWHMRSFDCLKFRTMMPNSDRVFQRHLQTSPGAAQEWNESRKLKNDPRITTVGKVLRELSLDELPQLINILRGDMSVVGPRPVVLDELRLYGPNADSYLEARPGLTGAWQVSGRNDVSYAVRATLDRTYVEKWSLASDVVIILKTIPAVISAKGSY